MIFKESGYFTLNLSLFLLFQLWILKEKKDNLSKVGSIIFSFMTVASKYSKAPLISLLLLIAFPQAHSAILQTLYLPATFMLMGLILRGVSLFLYLNGGYLALANYFS